jgi:hypothetical protein
VGGFDFVYMISAMTVLFFQLFSRTYLNHFLLSSSDLFALLIGWPNKLKKFSPSLSLLDRVLRLPAKTERSVSQPRTSK